MVYYETRKIKNKVYNYVIHNERKNNKWVKKSKFIGRGAVSKDKINEEIKKFEFEMKINRVYRFLSKEEIKEIELIKNCFEKYKKNAGSSGVEKLKEWFSTDFTYNTNAIEGSTLSLKDVHRLLNEKKAPKNADLKEIYEVQNHKLAYEFLDNHKGDLNEKLILKIHSFILKNIDDYNAGRYREVNVYITGSNIKLPEPENAPLLMKNLIRWYQNSKKDYHPFELAVIVSMKFVMIHPFVDGNGRVSRLIMNFLMKKYGFPEINVLFKNREEYMECTRKANDEKYESIIKFIIKTLKNNYKTLLFGDKKLK